MKFKNEVFAVGFNPRMGWLTGVAMNADEAFKLSGKIIREEDLEDYFDDEEVENLNEQASPFVEFEVFEADE